MLVLTQNLCLVVVQLALVQNRVVVLPSDIVI